MTLALAVVATACGVVLPPADDGEPGDDANEHDPVTTKGATMPTENGAAGNTGVSVTGSAGAAGAAGTRVYAVFVTSEAWSSDDIGGLAGADQKCTRLANGTNAAAPLKGKKWAAWLSDDGTSALSRLGTTPGPWSRVDGSKVAQDRGQLSNPQLPLFAAIAIDEQALPHDDSVWTGTSPDGSSAGKVCDGWTGKSGRGVYGRIELDKPDWTAAGDADCSGPSDEDWDIDLKTAAATMPRKRLYCFEID